MAAVTILAVEQGWAGDRKRNRVALTLPQTDTSTVTPQQVGLKVIEAVVDAGLRTGTVAIEGTNVTLTAYGTGPYVGWATDSITVTVQTAGNAILYFYGW